MLNILFYFLIICILAGIMRNFEGFDVHSIEDPVLARNRKQSYENVLQNSDSSRNKMSNKYTSIKHASINPTHILTSTGQDNCFELCDLNSDSCKGVFIDEEKKQCWLSTNEGYIQNESTVAKTKKGKPRYNVHFKQKFTPFIEERPELHSLDEKTDTFRIHLQRLRTYLKKKMLTEAHEETLILEDIFIKDS
jgi:hypothetical protein